MTNFSNALRSLRTEKGLSQGQLSEALGVSKSRISMYEQGKREPDLEMLVSIADYFNVSTDELLGRSKDSSAIPAQATIETKELNKLIDIVKELDIENIKLLQKVAKAMMK